MNKTWTALCKANVDHYNNHTSSHNAITAVYGVVALVVVAKLSKRIGDPNNFSRN